MKLGYARVSTAGQSLAEQRAALEDAGCRRIYSEKKSGKNDDRAALQRMLKDATSGDIIVVTRLDRLARSTRDLLKPRAAITAKGAGFRSRHHDRARPLTLIVLRRAR